MTEQEQIDDLKSNLYLLQKQIEEIKLTIELRLNDLELELKEHKFLSLIKSIR